MADTFLRTLVTRFEADTSGMTAAVSSLDSTVDAATQSMSANIGALEDTINSLASSAGGSIASIGTEFSSLALGGLGAVAGLVAGLSGVSKTLSDLGDRSDDLRLPANLLAALGVAAAQAR